MDRISADLAEVLDTLFKSKWREVGMTEVIDRLVAWLIPGGQAFLQTVLDAKAGPMREMRGDSLVPVMQMDQASESWQPVLDAGGAPATQYVKGKIGFKRGPGGKPIAVSHVLPNGQVFDREKPESYPEGDLRVDVLSPVQVRGEWGPTPWHQKRWHTVRTWLTPPEIWELFGVEEQGETPSVSVATSDPGFLQRMFFGSGYFGAASDKPGSEWATMPTREDFVEVFVRWEVPSAFPGMERRPGTDGEVEMTNKPGERFTVMRRPNVPAFEYVQPPSLGRDVYQTLEILRREFQDLGHIEGAEGRAPTPDPSGKLIRELRFNSDRFLGPTARRAVEELARMYEDWMEWAKIIYDEEKVVTYVGEDSIPRTLSVYPEVYVKGAVHVIADIESMLPQSRAERQSQISTLYTMGVFGQPGAPGAVQKFLEMARFPHLGRTAWPGGVHVTMAQQNNAKLMQGVAAAQIPIFDWYDNSVHLVVLEEFMAGPYYLRLTPVMQQQFAILRQLHKNAAQAKALQMAVQNQEFAGGVAAHGAIVQRAAAKAAGVPDPTQGVAGDAMSQEQQGAPQGAGQGEQ